MASNVGCRIDDEMREKLTEKMRRKNYLNISEYIRSVLRKEIEA